MGLDWDIIYKDLNFIISNFNFHASFAVINCILW